MDELEKKLDQAIMDTIWITKIDDRVKERVHPYWFNANGQTFTFGVDTERIKQILKDAARSGNSYGQHNGHLLTGSEWLERFERELEGKIYAFDENGSKKIVDAVNACHVAAKKAAGVEG